MGWMSVPEWRPLEAPSKEKTGGTVFDDEGHPPGCPIDLEALRCLFADLDDEDDPAVHAFMARSNTPVSRRSMSRTSRSRGASCTSPGPGYEGLDRNGDQNCLRNGEETWWSSRGVDSQGGFF